MCFYNLDLFNTRLSVFVIYTVLSLSFKFLYFQVSIKHKEQDLRRKEGGDVKTKTHGVKICLYT